MQVKDIMTQTVEAVRPNATLNEAARRMHEVDAGMLPVLDGTVVVGVVTDRDLAVRAIAQGLDPKTATVEEVMTPQVRYCYDDQSVEEAAGMMADTGLRRLVVLDRTMRLTGIVSLDDVAISAENVALAGETLEQTVSRPDRMRGRYERILVALDGSGLAEHVFATIQPLAQQFGSRVILLRVVTPDHAPIIAEGVESDTSANPAAGDAVATADDTAYREATRYLTTVQQRLAAQGMTVESEYREGPASEMILRRARQLGADLIALTTHGRTGIDRLLLGSVAEDIVRRAPCPVLLVRVRGGQ
jgi:nucleotide-binding universal stress UspA family protein/CBS domain-containing protein